jgi:hypothetical protein
MKFIENKTGRKWGSGQLRVTAPGMAGCAVGGSYFQIGANRGIYRIEMMRSPISFKTALVRSRTLYAEIAPQAGELGTADLAHLQRWAAHPLAEAVWRKIQNLAWEPVESYDPLEGFIATILVARQMAAAIPIYHHLVEKDKHRSRRNLDLARQSENRATLWKGVASSSNGAKADLALKRANFHLEEAGMFRKLAQKSARRLPFQISRVDKNGSQKQRAFMQLVGEYIVDLCGKALDTEVAILNDNAFDTREPTSPFQARSARKATTLHGRLKAPRTFDAKETG